mmetsp:Transcript_17976/g.39863  ORF Transcript_17976/g.39863 Transcript_17976/m.39863 type:complete len:124 (+) Transcript_17976:14-385(+)
MSSVFEPSESQVGQGQSESQVVQSLVESESLTLAFPSAMYEENASNNPMSISPRDQLSLIDDKRLYRETVKFLDKSDAVQRFVRMLQVEVLRRKPADVLAFINDEIFSLENQSKLRVSFGNGS